MKKYSTYYIICFLLFAATQNGTAQQISIDRGIRVASLWCFPSVTDSTTYFYLPINGKLSKNENNDPQFSFIRYVNDALETKATINSSMGIAGGGGILHFLVEYDTPPSLIENAEAALKQQTNNRNVKIKGPILFTAGNYALISTIINPDNGQQEKKLFATGMAPVLEGSRVALSFSMDAKSSKILMESFNTSTPDLSLVFDLSFNGLSDAYDAELLIDWSEVKKSFGVKAGVQLYVVGVEAEYAIDKLIKNNGITLKTVGTDANTEALLNNVYGKLLTLLFEPASPEVFPQNHSSSAVADAISAVMGGSGSANSYGIGISAGFHLKEMTTEGKSVIRFNSRTSSSRHHYITFNIGDLYAKYGNNKNVFKTVSLDDPKYQVRNIQVGLDGDLANEFDNMINNVSVTLKKVHDDSTETIEQLSIDKKKMVSGEQQFLSYGAVGDTNRLGWFNYQYKTSFQFSGGKFFETGWKTQSDAHISVYSPYQRKHIAIDGDTSVFKNRNVRVVLVQISYPFFNEVRKEQISIRQGEDLSNKKFDITLPLNQPEYSYKISWVSPDGKTTSATGNDNTGIIFIDTISSSQQ